MKRTFIHVQTSLDEQAAAACGYVRDADPIPTPLQQVDAITFFEAMIERFVRAHVLPMQLIVEAAVHTPHDSSPHVHFQISCRKWLPSATFGAPIYGATSRQTLTKWRRGWIERMMALPSH